MFKKRTDKIKLDHKHFYDFQTISRDIRTYYKSDEEIKPNKDIMENVYKFIGTNNISISAGNSAEMYNLLHQAYNLGYQNGKNAKYTNCYDALKGLYPFILQQ